MSDLWKDHKPELTEEEDRLLWQRVRAIPASPPPALPDPWWKRLFAMPEVRYGAPALAVLIAAVVYVVQQAPQPTLRPAARTTAPAPVETNAPAPDGQEHPRRVVPMSVKVVDRPPSGLDQPTTEDRARNTSPAAGAAVPAAEPAKENEAAAKDERQEEVRQELRFAEPPALQKSKAAAPSPSPVTAGSERKQAAPSAPQAAMSAPQVAQQESGATWGAKKSLYRDGGPALPATGLSGLLAGSALPSKSAVASHLVVLETAGPGALSGSVPLPDEPGAHAVIALSPDAAPVVRIETASLGLLRDVKRDGQYAKFEDAPARLQAAALAAAFERALASPSTTPRTKVEKLLVRAQAVAARGDATPGAARLVSMIEGALQVWPSK